ncbi:MAG: hypothetical protein IPG07_21355 [Crocinitomicaceae bacterium]|nr:hypothetical protein [Crocinitomicaceae bacterium]
MSFLLVYVVLTVSFGIRSAGSLSKGLQVAKVFPVLHFSYGWGYLKGLIDFVILRRKPAGSAGKLSR